MPRISIVGPCYNVAKYLDAYVESVLAQTVTDWELILVDDGSPDESGTMIDSWCRKDPRIRAVHRVNGGLSAARNSGFDACSADSRFVMFPDPDDCLEPTALAELSAQLEAHPDAGAVLCHQSLMDSNGARIEGGQRDRWASRFGLPRKLTDADPTIPFVTFFCGSAAGPYVLWTKEALEKAGPWDVLLAPWEDSDMFCRVALFSEIRFLPKALYRYRKHPTQATTNGQKMRRYYDLFRAKWELPEGETPAQKETLRKARSFYWRMYRPCRNLGVLPKALSQFLRKPSKKGAWWIKFLLGSTLTQFAGKRPELPSWPPQPTRT